MESLDLLGVLFLILAGLFYYKDKAEAKAAEAELAEMRGRDAELKKQQDEIKSEITEIENQDDSNLTPEERAQRWSK